MTNQELINKVAEDRGLTKVEAKELVEYLTNTIVEVAMKDGKVPFGKFGNFKKVEVKAKPAREGRNPTTGDKIQIPAKPARAKLTFSLSKAGKELGA